ncbi:MAG: preprotein translocase subunit SecG [Candidatus Kapaibacteriota bacterium]|jgi:protein translocase SecG subunit
MATILILLSLFAAILLILVVLIQPGKSEMISGMGGLGGQAANLFGVRQSRNVLQNLTIGLTISLMVMALLVNRLFIGDEGTAGRVPVTQGVTIPQPTSTPTTAPASAPAPAPAPTPTQQAPADQPAGN